MPAAPVPGQECLARLGGEGVIFRAVPPPDSPHPCGISVPVSVSAAGAAFNRPVLMECGLAEALARWQRDVVQPAALRDLGHSVRSALQVGAYVCRQEIGSGRNYTSEHAFGRAIDISGWALDDGTTVMVGRDWSAGGGREAFLHDISRDACGIFSVVLTPAVNAAHHGHIHLDIGPYRFCGKGSGLDKPPESRLDFRRQARFLVFRRCRATRNSDMIRAIPDRRLDQPIASLIEG